MRHTADHETYEGLLVEYEVAASLFVRPTDAGRFGAELKTVIEGLLPGAFIQVVHDDHMGRTEWTKILEPGLYSEGPGRSLGGSALGDGRDHWYDLEAVDAAVGSAAKALGAGFAWGSRTASGEGLERSWGGYSSFRTLRHSEEDDTEEAETDELAETLQEAWDRR